VLTDDQRNDIKLLSMFRNKFVHFLPESWLIEKVGLPRIIGVALDVIDELMKRPRLLRRYDETWRERLAELLRTARDALHLPGGSP